VVVRISPNDKNNPPRGFAILQGQLDRSLATLLLPQRTEALRRPHPQAPTRSPAKPARSGPPTWSGNEDREALGTRRVRTHSLEPAGGHSFSRLRSSAGTRIVARMAQVVPPDGRIASGRPCQTAWRFAAGLVLMGSRQEQAVRQEPQRTCGSSMDAETHLAEVTCVRQSGASRPSLGSQQGMETPASLSTPGRA
jgi:hypothetical protein